MKGISRCHRDDGLLEYTVSRPEPLIAHVRAICPVCHGGFGFTVVAEEATLARLFGDTSAVFPLMDCLSSMREEHVCGY